MPALLLKNARLGRSHWLTGIDLLKNESADVAVGYKFFKY